MRGQQLKSAFLDLVQQQGVDFGDQGPQAYEIRLNFIDHFGCFQGMFCRPINAAQTEDDVFAELNSSLFDNLARLNLLPGACSLFHFFQDGVITAFKPHMNANQTGLMKQLHIQQPLLNDILRRSIYRHSLQFRELRFAVAAYGG